MLVMAVLTVGGKVKLNACDSARISLLVLSCYGGASH